MQKYELFGGFDGKPASMVREYITSNAKQPLTGNAGCWGRKQTAGKLCESGKPVGVCLPPSKNVTDFSDQGNCQVIIQLRCSRCKCRFGLKLRTLPGNFIHTRHKVKLQRLRAGGIPPLPARPSRVDRSCGTGVGASPNHSVTSSSPKNPPSKILNRGSNKQLAAASF